MTCKLCELVKNPDTEVLWENKFFIVMDGMKKDNYQRKWLCIWKEHKKELSGDDLRYFIDTLLMIRTTLDGRHDIVIGLYSIPDHYHVHLAKV
jgi:hypothetical protein